MTTLLPTDPAELGRQLRPATHWLVVVDLDGTLAPIVDHPDQVQLAPGAGDALAALAAQTPVALLSGRPIDDLRSRVGELPITFVGGHGAELHLADGRRIQMLDPQEVDATLAMVAEDIAGVVGDASGWLVERKAASVAVHHRLAPPAEVEDLLPRVQALLARASDTPPGFEVLEGKAVIELRPRGVDKGTALDRIAEQHPAHTPLVLGDDVTDEDAFRAATARGGTAVLVATAPRETAATYRIADPDDVVQLLAVLGS